MVNPQKENGHTAIANELMEAFARISLNGTQYRLLMVILRKTYGWQKKMDTIGLLQFCEATGLPKALVSRELIRLTRRRIIIAWGDDHHAKQFGVQKDYGQWLDADPPEVSTNQYTPSPKVSTKKAKSVYQSVDEVSTKRSTTKESKAIKTEPNGSGSLRDRFEAKYQTAGNKGAVIGELFSLLLGAEPDYPRLGRMAKELNSGGKLMDLIIDASKQRISDDPHDYLAKMVKRAKTEGRPGKLGQADLNSGKRGGFVQ